MIPTWISGPLASLAVYWFLSLANRPHPSGPNFRPITPVRVLYPAVLAGLLVMIPFGVYDIATNHQPMRWNEWIAYCVLPVTCTALVITWPPTITVTESGLLWSRLLSRRFISWSDIELAAMAVDDRTVIYCRNGKEYEVSSLVQGRRELVGLIQQRLHKAAHPVVRL